MAKRNKITIARRRLKKEEKKAAIEAEYKAIQKRIEQLKKKK